MTADPMDAGAHPEVTVRIKALDCGKCFELLAEAEAGQPPYTFEWMDGSAGAQHQVCVNAAPVSLSVVAVDANASRSAPQTIHLEGPADASCPQATIDAGPAPRLCLGNASFEGMPTVNFGQSTVFDLPPWSACTNTGLPNTPDVGNETSAQTTGVPPPTDGLTYVALGEGEQVSQELCAEVADETEFHLALDLSRVDLGEITPQTEQVFLEIWGGLSVDCSLREKLWTSDALQTGWKTFCVTLRPHDFMTQLTLLATTDGTSLGPAYLLVDNLQPVDSCP